MSRKLVAASAFVLMIGGAASAEACAREQFELGSSALQEGRFEDGVAKLEASIRCERTAPALFNLAVGLRHLGRATEAIETLESLRDDPPSGALGVEERAALVAELELATQTLATLAVEVDADVEAEVFVDDRSVGETQEGRLTVSVDPGTVIVAAEAPGFSRREGELRLESGRTERLQLRLSPGTWGRIVVHADDPDARIEIVGQSEGRGTLDLEVPPTVHSVRLAEPDGSFRTREVEVSPGETVRLRFDRQRSDGGGVPLWVWIAGGTVVAAGLVTALVFLLPSDSEPVEPNTGLTFSVLRGP
ncbi:MAG: hypothetical protein AAGF12_28335 [Myxococcota bacterium]